MCSVLPSATTPRTVDGGRPLCRTSDRLTCTPPLRHACERPIRHIVSSVLPVHHKARNIAWVFRRSLTLPRRGGRSHLHAVSDGRRVPRTLIAERPCARRSTPVGVGKQ
ncbi:hypothetical protein FCH28_01885 [Streptomyces piniterrae]|uniref:Uncharacterized protein n=1 Tax=Streptomyces piniterrae TaxID=2571125 RepID=A0A4U0NW39_9ACTN|nr:hypothetical protein FCH28_01885 [Streptomyces piniterrae]